MPVLTCWSVPARKIEFTAQWASNIDQVSPLTWAPRISQHEQPSVCDHIYLDAAIKGHQTLKNLTLRNYFPNTTYIYICMFTLGWLKRGQFRWIWNTWVSANIKVLFSVTAHGILQTRGRTSGQSVPACTSKIPAGIHWECSAKEKLQYPYVYILYIPCML